MKTDVSDQSVSQPASLYCERTEQTPVGRAAPSPLLNTSCSEHSQDWFAGTSIGSNNVITNQPLSPHQYLARPSHNHHTAHISHILTSPGAQLINSSCRFEAAGNIAGDQVRLPGPGPQGPAGRLRGAERERPGPDCGASRCRPLLSPGRLLHRVQPGAGHTSGDPLPLHPPAPPPYRPQGAGQRHHLGHGGDAGAQSHPDGEQV